MNNLLSIYKQAIAKYMKQKLKRRVLGHSYKGLHLHDKKDRVRVHGKFIFKKVNGLKDKINLDFEYKLDGKNDIVIL